MLDLPAGLRDKVMAWIANDTDDELGRASQAELTLLLERAEIGPQSEQLAAVHELTDRFTAPLSFGTAGLRGPMRAGPNGMNSATVRLAAAGLSQYLADDGRRGGIVVVGYDGRHNSHAFAEASAAVFAAAGFDARLLPRMLPTPLVPYAVKRFGAAAGVMVTASHNPPKDNGYKVYAADGAQIVPPMDREIEARIRGVSAAREVAQSSSYSTLAEAIVEEYEHAVVDLLSAGNRADGVAPRELSVVYTAMHGVGSSVLRAVFASAGFSPPHEVLAQAEPDPDFPTVAFPNPEEPGAIDLALALAREVEADLVIANDPDADRCAVAASFDDNWRMLTGDEVGVLLADHLLRKGIKGTYATTIVSSSMLSAVAAKRQVSYAETLTGFKWIARAAPDLVYGYEEALGYAVAPALVRDKDGISAAVLIAELGATLKSEGSDVAGRLAALTAEFGHYATRQLSWRVEEPELIAAGMRRLRTTPPDRLLGCAVDVTDLAPDNDVLILRFDGSSSDLFSRGRVVVRPSGTEPKCKAYLELVVPAAHRGEHEVQHAHVEQILRALGAEIATVVGF